MSARWSSALFAFLALSPCAADAQTDRSWPHSVARDFEVRAEGVAGVAGGEVSGLSYGAGLFARYWAFQAGAAWQWGGAQKFLGFEGFAEFTSVTFALGALFEPSGPSGRVKIDALLTGGWHDYRNVGVREEAHLLGATTRLVEGISASGVPFLGARFGARAAWGGVVRFTLGASLLVEADLVRVERTRRTWPGGCSGSACETSGETSSATIGGVQIGAIVSVGVALQP